MNLHLKKKIDITDFLKHVMDCEGEVYFETTEGDSLTLKSTLSQYIFCTVTDEDDLLRRGRIRLTCPADAARLSAYCEPYCCDGGDAAASTERPTAGRDGA